MTESIYYFLLENEIELWTSPDPRKHMQFKRWKCLSKIFKDEDQKCVLIVGVALIFNLEGLNQSVIIIIFNFYVMVEDNLYRRNKLCPFSLYANFLYQVASTLNEAYSDVIKCLSLIRWQ